MISIFVNIGMWFERFVIIVTSLHRDFLPSSWAYFRPTIWDFAALIGSFGLFFTLFCLFVRFVPMVATAEVKTVLPEADPHHGSAAGPGAPAPVPALPAGERFGLLAEFTTPAVLYRACESVRDAGYTRWDAHTPFPVHGLDRAMGLKRSKLPWIVFVLAMGGAAGGFALQTWVHSVAYPSVISGKPFFAWPAYIPVTFELGVLRRGARRGARHPRAQPAAAPPPPALRVEQLRARERRPLLHLDRVARPALRRERDAGAAAPGRRLPARVADRVRRMR